MNTAITKLENEIAFLYLYPPASMRVIERKEKQLVDLQHNECIIRQQRRQHTRGETHQFTT